METKTEMTVKDLLSQVHDNMSRIRVPCSEMQEIGIPLAQAISAIEACIDAIARAEAQAKPEEPEIEIVPVEDGEPDA